MDELPRVLPFGERAFLVELGRDIDAATNARVVALASQLDGTDHGIAGLGRSVPAYASLLVPFDPALAEPATVSRRLRKLAEETVARVVDLDARRIRIPVRYGDDDGPDLAAVAERAGISTSAVIELHTSVSYRVFMLGFAPGFAYLGSLPEPMRLPRRAEPRVRVPPGSVAIAAAQTAVYPHATAGGWHLLGRTDMQLWDPHAEEPALLRPGDLVRFVAV